MSLEAVTLNPIFAQKRVPFRRVSSYTVVHADRHMVYLNPSGSDIWDRIDGKRGCEEIVQELFETNKYGAMDRDTVMDRAKDAMFALYFSGVLDIAGAGVERAALAYMRSR